MDHDWITTHASGNEITVQVSIASEGGSVAVVRDLSIEVNDVDDIYRRAMRLGNEIEYEVTTEPWGVRRFYLHDPTGKPLNVCAHVS